MKLCEYIFFYCMLLFAGEYSKYILNAAWKWLWDGGSIESSTLHRQENVVCEIPTTSTYSSALKSENFPVKKPYSTHEKKRSLPKTFPLLVSRFFLDHGTGTDCNIQAWSWIFSPACEIFVPKLRVSLEFVRLRIDWTFSCFLSSFPWFWIEYLGHGRLEQVQTWLHNRLNVYDCGLMLLKELDVLNALKLFVNVRRHLLIESPYLFFAFLLRYPQTASNRFSGWKC